MRLLARHPVFHPASSKAPATFPATTPTVTSYFVFALKLLNLQIADAAQLRSRKRFSQILYRLRKTNFPAAKLKRQVYYNYSPYLKSCDLNQCCLYLASNRQLVRCVPRSDQQQYTSVAPGWGYGYGAQAKRRQREQEKAKREEAQRTQHDYDDFDMTYDDELDRTYTQPFTDTFPSTQNDFDANKSLPALPEEVPESASPYRMY
uniref:Uncharacterized protein n=1 Tax=Syphacia muris TaxID=451379 RepID=A0A0N5AHM2_9BILA